MQILRKLIPFLITGTLIFFSCSDQTNVKSGKWELSTDQNTGNIRIVKNEKEIINSSYAAFELDGKTVKTSDYKSKKVQQQSLKDQFGEGILWKIEYTQENLPNLIQYFYVYPEKDYLLTEFVIESNDTLACNYMAPVNADAMSAILEAGENRALFIPFDNDCWIRYKSHQLNFAELISYEVSAIFNNDSRNGLVIGSVEHSDWKTAVKMSASDNTNLSALHCYGGIADSLTRDSKAHGFLKGTSIKSPKILLGFFDDWRKGLEEYGKANAVVAPPKAWNKAMPVGWNSWGVLQFNLTYPKAIEVSDFFKDNLQNNHFINADNTVIIGLDSGWNSFTEEELKSFVDHCKANGQIAGVYWTPFTDWAKDPERTIKDAPEYKFKDVYLYANGQPQNLDGAFAIDPTHPAIEAQMKKTSELFHRTGFEYVKMDFMTHGAMESDAWYNPEIRTGIQAYNYGMQLLNQYFGDMYINISISPTFPAHYAQSRRIACDAWNKIKDTEYTMNALSYGWWQDYVYQFNDADHIVLQDATEGENRARVTSGVITGLYIAGDDFSNGGSAQGKERARQFLTNAEVNAVAKGNSFYPVDGNSELSENQFVFKDQDNTFYYVIFNYQDQELKLDISLERIGLDTSKEYQIKELWSGNEISVKESFNVTVPPKDVLFFKSLN